jgi:hypothetical protein
MNENWAGSPTGQDGEYPNNEGWKFPAQIYQQPLNEAGAALSETPFHQPADTIKFDESAAASSRDPLHQSAVSAEFSPFEQDLHFGSQSNQEDAQYDGQPLQGGQYENQASVADAPGKGQADQAVDSDNNPAYHPDRDEKEAGEEDGQYELDPDQGNKLQQGIDLMIAGGVYKGLLPTEAAYFTESRVERELQELKRGGATGPNLDNVSMQFWVAQLFMAFKTVDGIKDKPCKNGKPAQSARRLGGNYYPDMAIELVCWRIVVSSILLFYCNCC